MYKKVSISEKNITNILFSSKNETRGLIILTNHNEIHFQIYFQGWTEENKQWFFLHSDQFDTKKNSTNLQNNIQMSSTLSITASKTITTVYIGAPTTPEVVQTGTSR